MDGTHMAIAVAGAVFFIWFALPLALKGIVNSGNLTGMAVSAFLLFYGIFYRKVHTFAGEVRQKPDGKIAAGFLLLLALAVVCIVVAETIGMVRIAANRPPANTTAVVLGCKVKGTVPSRVLAERLDAAYVYLTQNSEARCVLSGGQGTDEEISEAECMYRYLTGKGISAKRLLREEKSTTTEENLRYSAQLLAREGMDGAITIVTSEFHEYRANETAKRLGITSYSTPSRTGLLYLPTYYVRELYGILYYRLRRNV